MDVAVRVSFSCGEGGKGGGRSINTNRIGIERARRDENSETFNSMSNYYQWGIGSQDREGS